MPMQKHRLVSEEFSCSSLEGTLQERTKELTRVFRILIPDLCIDYVESISITWVGNFHLKGFTENLLKLKTEDLVVYTYLRENHKEALEGAKKLLAKLRLQGLPAPSLYLDYSYYHEEQQEVTGTHIKIGKAAPYWYFCRLYEKEYWDLPFSHRAEAGEQEKQYLSDVRPVLEALYEAIALTAYLHLQPVHGKTII